MKNIVGLMLVMLITVSMYAQTAETNTIIEKANTFYVEKKFAEAADLYEQVVSLGFQSSELFYNLGNAYYKSNKFPKAILYYEKALKLNPTDSKIVFNLQFVRQQALRDKIEIIPENPFTALIRVVVGKFSSKSWSIYSITFFTLALGAVLFFLFARHKNIRKLAFSMASVFLLISLFTFFAAYKGASYQRNQNTAIIMAPVVLVKSSPDEGSTDLFRIHEGLKVFVNDNSGEWVEVKLEDGRVGWVKNSEIERI